MKKFKKEDLTKMFNNIKESAKAIKEFTEDLIYVSKGYISNGLKAVKEDYFIHKEDLKEEKNRDIKYIREMNSKYSEEDKKGYAKHNEDLNIDMTLCKIEIKPELLEGLKKDIEEYVETLNKNNSYNEIRLTNLNVEKMDKLEETSKKLNGTFKIDFSRDEVVASIMNKNDNGLVDTFKFKPSDRDEFTERLTKLYNDTLNEGEEKFTNKDFDKIFQNITDASPYEQANRNSRVILFVGGKDNENTLEIINDDKKLSLRGEEFNVGELMSLDNYSVALFDIEQDKVEKITKSTYDIKYEVSQIKENILKNESFSTLKDNVFSVVLSDIEIREKTENFQKDTNCLGLKVEEVFEDVFDGLGTDFTNQFLINNAEELGLTVANGKIQEVLDMGNSDDYDKNLKQVIRNTYLNEVHDFQERMDNFGSNLSTKVEDKFTETEISGFANNRVKKLEKVYDDIYKYGQEKGFEGAKNYSGLAKSVGLEVNEFSSKYDNLDKKFNPDREDIKVTEKTTKELNEREFKEETKDKEMDF